MDTLRVLPNLLSPTECRHFIQRAEEQGYLAMKGDYPPSYRDNDRILIDDPELAGQLFERFEAGLPRLLQVGGVSWYLTGLNTRFRGCRYRGGQRFVRHRDGAYSDPNGQRSFLTLMLYLNDHHDFEGGHTRFYADRWTPRVARSVPPVAGTGIVFDHTFWHDGQAVSQGVKYVLRTDVMYRCEQRCPAGHSGYVWALAALPGGSLVSGARDKQIRVWEGDRTVQVLDFHSASVTCLSAVGKGFWSGGRDRRIGMWGRHGDKWVHHGGFEAHQGAVLSINSLAGRSVLTTGADDRARIWDASGALKRTFKTGQWPWVSTQLADGRVLIGCDDGTVQLLAPGSHCLLPWHKTSCGVTSLQEIEGVVYGGCRDGSIRRWQIHGKELPIWTGHRGPVTALHSLPGGRLVSGAEDDAVRVWSADGTSREVLNHADFVRALAVTTDGELVTGSYDGTVRRIKIPGPGEYQGW